MPAAEIKISDCLVLRYTLLLDEKRTKIINADSVLVHISNRIQNPEQFLAAIKLINIFILNKPILLKACIKKVNKVLHFIS